MEEDNKYADETLYSQTELLQLIYGLMNVYWSKNWLGRLISRPWHDALQTLALQVAGDKIAQAVEAKEAVKFWEGKLEE